MRHENESEILPVSLVKFVDRQIYTTSLLLPIVSVLTVKDLFSVFLPEVGSDLLFCFQQNYVNTCDLFPFAIGAI